MNKTVKCWAYAKPAVETIHLASHNELMNTSFPNNGGHNKAGDDGEELNAKQGWFDEEEEESLTPGPSPSGEGRNYPWD